MLVNNHLMKVFLLRYMIDPAKIRHRMVINTPMVKLLLSARKSHGVQFFLGPAYCLTRFFFAVFKKQKSFSSEIMMGSFVMEITMLS